MDFREAQSKRILINGTAYIVNDFVINKAAIFKVLDDVKTDQSQFKIPDASDNDINKILGIIYCITHDGYDKTLFEGFDIDEIRKILSIMTYMGIEENIIKYAVRNMFRAGIDKDIMPLIAQFNSYHDCLNIMINECPIPIYETAEISSIIDIIHKNESLPMDFRLKFVVMLIRTQLYGFDFDIILGVTLKYLNMGKYINNILHLIEDEDDRLIQINSIKKPIQKIYQQYLNIEPKIRDRYDTEKLELTTLKINDKKIPLIDHKKTFTMGTLGCNTMMSVVTHIARILLGMDTLA